MNTSLRRTLTVLAAPVAALSVWILAVPVAGTTLNVRMGDATQTVEAVPVAVSSLLAGLAGWALLAILERLTSRPRRVWTTIAVTVWILSLLGPLNSAVATPATLVLLLMHLTVGAIVILGFSVWGRR
ncbi:DUF6069 family protein [Streptosporangium saharense]|uniref:Transmembrane protein n=1 Tax=Streptosporangium saharense TaxID=1706840 RepID=A0A7W7QTS0_9ACTN|nr:DUF6069 family protein [Streptosporangium saharense]MBB4919061.1 hypothetical protein [Streptosporangium saharense]